MIQRWIVTSAKPECITVFCEAESEYDAYAMARDMHPKVDWIRIEPWDGTEHAHGPEIKHEE